MTRTERLSRPTRLSHLSRAQALALACLLVGVAGEALLRHSRLGLNLTVLVLLTATLHARFTEVLWQTKSSLGTIRRRRWIAALVPALASAPVFLLDSAWSRFFAIPLTFAWLLLVPRFVEHGFALSVFGRTPGRAAEAIARVAPALARLFRLPRELFPLASGEEDNPSREPSTARTLLLGLGLGVPSALVFILLFSFDPKFSAALVSFGRRSDETLAFAASAVGLAVLLLLLVTVEELRKTVTPIRVVAPTVEPYRGPPREDDETSAVTVARTPFTLPPLAWSLVLMQVSAVFALYVGLHARELFAGHEYVRTTRGVTYASQLHAGFFALCVATALSTGLVLAGHAIFSKRRDAWSARTTRSVIASELLLVLLTVPTLASSGQKLFLYVEAYGQTYLRLGVLLAIATTFPLLALTALKSVRPSWTGFGAATCLVVLGALTGAAWFDADAHVARVNVERALRGKPLHDEHLLSLGDRTWLGLAAARPSDPDALLRWEAIVRGLARERSEAGPSADLRGFRRRTSCEDALGTLCR